MSSNGALRTVEELVPSGNFIGTSTADVRIPLIVSSGNRVVLVAGMLNTLSGSLLIGESIAPPARAFIPSTGDSMTGRLSDKPPLLDEQKADETSAPCQGKRDHKIRRLRERNSKIWRGRSEGNGSRGAVNGHSLRFKYRA